VRVVVTGLAFPDRPAGGTVYDWYGVYNEAPSVALSLANTTIEDCSRGVVIGSGAWGTVDACTFLDNEIGMQVISSSTPTISGSTFDGNTTDGIYCYAGAHISIEGNHIENSGLGIYCVSSSPTIQGENVIEENTTGIRCDVNASPGVYGNKIASNGNGVLASNGSEPHLGGAPEGSCDSTSTGGNKIIDNTYHVSVQSQVTVMAECNWWGTKKAPPASKFIGSVDYTPWLASDPLPGLVSAYRPENAEHVIPDRFDLLPGAPNPFNPSTRIRFEVPVPGAEVALEVFDVQGRRIQTLTRGYRPPGEHMVIWDGRDHRGGRVATGVYFVRMRAGSFTKTQKLVLLK
jgi:hypothetical protein